MAIMVLGMNLPFSIVLIVFLVTPINSANCSWVKFILARCTFIVFFSISSLIVDYLIFVKA